MQPMYKGIPFSPRAALSAAIGEADTVIPVGDVSAFPSPPNYATVGADGGAETILYTAVTDSALSGCTRGVEGAAKAWDAGETIARNFTAADHEDLIGNVEGVDAALEAHAEDALSHIACVTTEGTAEAYTATVSGITGLTAGMLLTIIPHVDCASKTPTLDVNATGAIPLTRRSSARMTASSPPIIVDWLAQNEPVLLQYTGSRWVALDRTKPNASDLDGKAEIVHGGTGKTVWDANKLVCLSDSKAFDQVPFPTENGGFLRQDTSGAPYWSNSEKVLADIGAASALTSHAGDSEKHVTAAERAAWSAKETPEGAQAKADAATAAAKATSRPATWTPTAAEVGGLSGTDYSTIRVRGISAGTQDLTAGTSNLDSGTIYLMYE